MAKLNLNAPLAEVNPRSTASSRTTSRSTTPPTVPSTPASSIHSSTKSISHKVERSWAADQAQSHPWPSYSDSTTALTPNPQASWVSAQRIPERRFDAWGEDAGVNSEEEEEELENDEGLKHAEFGIEREGEKFGWTSEFRPHKGKFVVHREHQHDAGLFTYMTTYYTYLILILLGHMRDFFGRRFRREKYAHLMPHNGYAALNSDWDSFFTRRAKSRMDDSFSRPVTGVAGRTITLLDRKSEDRCLTFGFTGRMTQALNVSSYNYLGFAQSRGACADLVEESIVVNGVAVGGGARQEAGSWEGHVEAEALVAGFLGTEAAMLVSQGFATNSTTFPALVSKGSLIISDELNHSSIRFGARLSGALVRQYKHDDIKDLERVLRRAIGEGIPRKQRPWNKIVVVVEGIYSMEGTIVNLPAILALKEKYKFYLYVDEAHSIGALGPRGRGVCDYYSVDPRLCDVLMGTLTKSFGASGGYIAGSKAVIDHLRHHSHAAVYAESPSPAVVTQIVASLTSIMGIKEALIAVPRLRFTLSQGLSEGDGLERWEGGLGKERLRRLSFNSRYLHAGLRKLGFIVYGCRDSPIVPLIVFHPSKMVLFSRLLLERYNIAVVVVAYPATPVVLGRVRFCVSASHTKADIDRVLIATDDVGGCLGLKFAPREMGVEEVMERAEELVSGGVLAAVIAS